MSLFPLNQIISSRITSNSVSLLDLIMLSSSIDITTAGIDDLMHISYHLIVFAHLTLAKPHHRVLTFRRNLASISDVSLLCELGGC